MLTSPAGERMHAHALEDRPSRFDAFVRRRILLPNCMTVATPLERGRGATAVVVSNPEGSPEPPFSVSH